MIVKFFMVKKLKDNNVNIISSMKKKGTGMDDVRSKNG